MYCRKCGAENSDESKFCQKCGAQIGVKTTESKAVNEQIKQNAEENEKKQVGGCRKIVIIALIVIVLLAGILVLVRNIRVYNSQETANECLNTFLGSSPADYPEITYGQAFESFFSDGAWTGSFDSEKEEATLRFIGDCQCYLEDVSVTVRYTYEKDTGKISLQEFEIDEQKQASELANVYLDNIFGSYGTENHDLTVNGEIYDEEDSNQESGDEPESYESNNDGVDGNIDIDELKEEALHIAEEYNYDTTGELGEYIEFGEDDYFVLDQPSSIYAYYNCTTQMAGRGTILEEFADGMFLCKTDEGNYFLVIAYITSDNDSPLDQLSIDTFEYYENCWEYDWTYVYSE